MMRLLLLLLMVLTANSASTEAEMQRNKRNVEGFIDISALNRPFALGMLYDLRSDQLIPGLTLWDSEDIESDTTSRKHTSQRHKIVTSRSLSDKAELLDINANLQLSFMGGLVNVAGSAAYLNERVSSNLKERVTLFYKSETKFENLNMGTLAKKNIVYTEILDNKQATHVVTAIQYGAKVIFVFDKDNITSESKTDIKGTLDIVVKKIVTITGDASVELNEEENDFANSLDCTYTGDIILNPNPTSLSEALDIYKDLSQRVGDGIPTKVYLTPLTRFDSKAATLEREINLDEVLKLGKMFDGFHDIIQRCKDLLNNSIFQLLSWKDQLENFQSLVDRQKQIIQKKLKPILPLIRGGTQNGTALNDIIIKHLDSPYTIQKLQKWIKEKENDLKLIISHHKSFNGTKFLSTELLKNRILGPGYKDIIVLMMLIPFDSATKKIISMKEYSNITNSEFTNPENMISIENYDSSKLINSSKLFKDFYDANKISKSEEDNAIFVMSEIPTTSDDISGSIYHYRLGKLINTDFLPPSPPKDVTILKITKNSVTLNWEAAIKGTEDITKYEIIYHIFSDTTENETFNNAERIIDTQDNSTEFTITQLTAATAYIFKIRAVSETGTSAFSDATKNVVTLKNINSHDVSVMLKSLKETLKPVYAHEVYTSMISDEGEELIASVITRCGYLLVKSLKKKTAPTPEHAQIIPYNKLQASFNSSGITVFLELSFGSPPGPSKLVFIKILNTEGRGDQFRLLCSGEHRGVTYAGTSFIFVSSWIILAGDRNDGGGRSPLPGLTPGQDLNAPLTAGRVMGWYGDITATEFSIRAKDDDSTHPYTIGEVTHGLSHIRAAHSNALKQFGSGYNMEPEGAGSIKIIDTGIVIA